MEFKKNKQHFEFLKIFLSFIDYFLILDYISGMSYVSCDL